MDRFYTFLIYCVVVLFGWMINYIFSSGGTKSLLLPEIGIFIMLFGLYGIFVVLFKWGNKK